jgi:hypothetical protein
VWRAAFVNDDLHIFVTIFLKTCKKYGNINYEYYNYEDDEGCFCSVVFSSSRPVKKNVNIWENISGYFEHSSAE